MLAKALADGLSLEGTGEALSIGAAGLFLRSLTGNPMDVHLHTGVNLRRYLVQLEGLSLRNKLLALVALAHRARGAVDAESPGSLPAAGCGGRCGAALSDAGRTAGCHHREYLSPATDRLGSSDQPWTNAGRAGGENHRSISPSNTSTWATTPTAFIARLAEIVCHDNFTEMHAFKHHQAVVEEFYATREPWRWRHLVAGAQAAAISFGKNMEIYEEAIELLHA